KRSLNEEFHLSNHNGRVRTYSLSCSPEKLLRSYGKNTFRNGCSYCRKQRQFQLKDKRRLTFDSMFGHVDVQRNYYFYRETGKYVSLLDQLLAFDGSQMMSPVVQDLAIELA